MHYVKAIVLFFYFFTHTGNTEEFFISTELSHPTDLIIETLELNLDMPYDSKNIKGYDCSGLVQFCYASADIQIPRSSNQQYIKGEKVSIETAKIGDIICFTGRNKASEKVGHVGIIVSIHDDFIEFIHSSSSKGVITSSTKEKYYKERFRGIVRYS